MINRFYLSKFRKRNNLADDRELEGHDILSEPLLKKTIDQSLLKAGTTIPQKIHDQFLKAIGISLARGQKANIKIAIKDNEYDAILTNVDLSDHTRDVLQIRYSETSAICNALNNIFSYSASVISAVKADLSGDKKKIAIHEEYIEIYPIGHAKIEFKCIARSAKEKFLNYLGPEDSLSGYTRSYKLVFYRCFFDLFLTDNDVLANSLTRKFREYYLSRRRAGQIPDKDADSAIADIENSTLESVYRLILRNPFEAISNHGFIAKSTRSGSDYFYLDPQLQQELNPEDIRLIKTSVDKKLDLYFSKIDETHQTRKAETMKEIVEKILNEYTTARLQSFAGHSLGAYFRNHIPDAIYSTSIVDKEQYLIQASVGKGNWAIIPWICILIVQLQHRPKKGFIYATF